MESFISSGENEEMHMLTKLIN